MGGVYDSAIAQDYWASRYDCLGFVKKEDFFLPKLYKFEQILGVFMQMNKNPKLGL